MVHLICGTLNKKKQKQDINSFVIFSKFSKTQQSKNHSPYTIVLTKFMQQGPFQNGQKIRMTTFKNENLIVDQKG